MSSRAWKKWKKKVARRLGLWRSPLSVEKAEPILNRRPLMFAAIALATGQLLGALLANYLIATLVLLVVVFILAVVGLVWKRTRKIPLFFLFFGLLLFFISFQAHNLPADTGYASVEGVVVDFVETTEGSKRYLLDEVYLNGERIYEKVMLTTPETFTIKDRVVAEGEVTTFPYDPTDSRSMSYYHDGVQHFITAQAEKIADGDRNVLERFRARLTVAYRETMGEQGALARALFLGDRSGLTAETESAFRVSGVQHVFAVSGLHVTFLSGFVVWFCRKLRLNRRVGYAAALVVLVFYGLLTGFPASILRATITFFCFALSHFMLARPDSLSSLAAAYIVTQLIYPMSLFELGCQMSFLAVLGVVLFYPSLARALRNRPLLVRAVGKSLALSLSTNVFLVALLFRYFSVFGLYFAFSNIVVIPLISVAYTLLAPFSLLTAIWQGFSVLLVPVKWVLVAVTAIVNWIASFPAATVQVGNATAIGVVWACSAALQAPVLKIDERVRVRGGLLGLMLSVLILAVS